MAKMPPVIAMDGGWSDAVVLIVHTPGHPDDPTQYVILDTATPGDFTGPLADPIRRPVWVARLRAIADLIEQADEAVLTNASGRRVR